MFDRWFDLTPLVARGAKRRKRDAVAAVLVGERLEDRHANSIDGVHAVMFSNAMYHAAGAPAQVPGILAQLNANGSFKDLNYSGNSNASGEHYLRHGERVEQLSEAYQWNDPSNPYYHSPALLAQITKTWQFMSTAKGTTGTPNWWYSDIGVPRFFSAPLILMRNELPKSLVTAVLNKHFSGGGLWKDPGTGANLLDQAAAAFTEALLRGNTTRMKEVVSRASKEILKTTGEGMLNDLSFRQHGTQWISGSYGYDFLRSASMLVRYTHGSEFAFSPAAEQRVVTFVLDHLQWLNRGDLMEVTVQGRSITRPGFANTRGVILREEADKLVALDHRADELARLVQRYDYGVTEDNYLSGNVALWQSDGMMHQREGWTAGLRLTSSRNVGPETLNGENKRNHFEGDGQYTLLADGDEFGTDFNDQIYPVWNWLQLPGTTVEQYKGAWQRGGSSSSFVGTISDGDYGASVMDYRRSGLSVSAKKSYFFFDDELVALGADIDGTGANPVYTTLNQVIQDGDITVRGGDGSLQTLGLGQSVTIDDPKWIHEDSFGYVPLGDNGKITAKAQTQTGNWNQIGVYGGAVSLPVFTAYIDHGAKPKDATYAYAIVGGVQAGQMDAYVAQGSIQVLSNTAAIQAVRHRGTGVTQAVFYKAGSLQITPELTISVKQAGLVIVRETASGVEITVSDPTHKLQTIDVAVNGQYSGAAATRAASNLTNIRFTLPSGGNAGKSVSQTFTLQSGSQDPPPNDPPPPPPPNPTTPRLLQLAASEDTTVKSGTAANLNFGAASSLGIQFDSGSTSGRSEALLKFDLDAVAGNVAKAQLTLSPLSVPKGTTIVVAVLKDDTWQESTVTWNSRPGIVGELARVTAKPGQTITIDVSAAVRSALATDDVLSFKIYALSANGGPLVQLGSSESGATQPLLNLTLS